jgi:hypothetical protein
LFGGHPLMILLRLAVLSIVVGIVLSALGVRPDTLLYNLNVLARRIYDLGFGAIDSVLHYLVLGAMVVVPIWLIARLVGLGSRGPSDR